MNGNEVLARVVQQIQAEQRRLKRVTDREVTLASPLDLTAQAVRLAEAQGRVDAMEDLRDALTEEFTAEWRSE